MYSYIEGAPNRPCGKCQGTGITEDDPGFRVSCGLCGGVVGGIPIFEQPKPWIIYEELFSHGIKISHRTQFMKYKLKGLAGLPIPWYIIEKGDPWLPELEALGRHWCPEIMGVEPREVEKIWTTKVRGRRPLLVEDNRAVFEYAIRLHGRAKCSDLFDTTLHTITHYCRIFGV
jgi:hypothetical protein